MTIKGFIANVRKWRNGLCTIHKEEGISMLTLWVDSTWSFIVYGCTIRQYSLGHFYKLRSFERKRVLTYRKLFKLIRNTNNPAYIKYLENKELFNLHFAKFVNRKWTTSSKLDKDSYENLCGLESGIIVKPQDGMEGNGVYKISNEELNNSQNKEQIYQRLKSANAIIEECVCQHKDMFFGNSSVNTIRVMTLMDKNGIVSVIKALLRAGVGDCVVDNFHQGGCVYEIHKDMGRICSLGMSVSRKDLIIHPGTDICMLGYLIPNWDKVIEGCISAHKLLPQCRYISWDVAINNTGIEMIEGNHNGDYDMFEFVGTNKYWPILKKYL